MMMTARESALENTLLQNSEIHKPFPPNKMNYKVVIQMAVTA